MKHKKVRDYNEGRHVVAEALKVALDGMHAPAEIDRAGGLWLPIKFFDLLVKEAKRAHYVERFFKDGSIGVYGMRFHKTDVEYPWFYYPRGKKRYVIQIDIDKKKLGCPTLGGTALGGWQEPSRLLRGIDKVRGL